MKCIKIHIYYVQKDEKNGHQVCFSKQIIAWVAMANVAGRIASGSTSRLETLGCAIHSIQLGGCGGGMVLEWCANCDNGDWEGNRF